MESGFAQVTTTTDSADAAAALAKGAVERRLAACAHVTGPVSSTYWWQGKVDAGPEWKVVFKTTAASCPDLIAHVKANHGYEVPEVVVLSIVDGNPEYLDWIAKETVRE